MKLTALFLAAAACGALNAAELSANGVEVNGKVVAKSEWRRFDDGSAVRYVLPKGARRISRELTEWHLPEDAVVWFQGTDRDGFADYEAPYESCRVGDIKKGRVLSLPVTAKLPDGSYRMMTEANVVDYTDLAVKYDGGGRFVAYFHADRDGFDQSGESVTPWRVMLVAKDIQTLYASDIVRRLCPKAPAHRAKAVRERLAKAGRCIWQWLPAGAPKFHEQKDWYNRTKALGYEYYLIDEGWRGWGDDDARWAKLKECIDYGNSIGVKTFIWVNSNEMMNPQSRRAYLAKTAASGAVGIKIDFMPPPSCRIMKWYEETLTDTFDAGLIVDFHGAVKPTGRERFWPHELAREAIRGHEYHITRYNRVLPFEHDTILPFCRLVQGHGDYTPMVFEKSQLIHFTWARQLAQGIVYACPFLCFGDFPLNYLENPALGTIRSLAAVYDETRVLAPSEIGECVALARRKGKEWFIAVENGATPREFDIPLDFVKGTFEASVFMDAPDRLDAYTTDFRTVKKGDRLHVAMRAGGGYVAHLKPAVSATAWDGAVGDGRLACDFVADGVVRVQYALGDKLQDNATGVVLPHGALPFEVKTKYGGKRVTMTGGNLVVTIDKATGRIVFADGKGKVLLAESASKPHIARRVNTDKVEYDEKSARTEHTANGDVVVRDIISRRKGEETTQYQVRFDWKKDESLYGLGQHIEDYLDLRGKEQFLTHHNLKIAVPVLVSTAGYGLLFDAGSAMRFDDRDGAGLFEIEAAKELDYYFVAGPRMDDVIARYRKLTGECPMLPRYAFGYVQSKERYHSSDEIVSTLKRYRDLGVPIDVIVQDWNYWPQGWGYMKMDPKHYPDRPALAKAVHDLNARLMVSIWPNPQYCPQEEDFRKRGFMLPNNVYDVFNPAARDLYWQYANDEFFSCGFDAWWCDCSEPVDADWKPMPGGYGFESARERWEKNAEMLSDTLGAERSSLFSLYHAQGIYEHQRAATGKKRVVNLTRSSWAGQQRYSTISWNGDTSADWASFKRQIPSGLNFMASGAPYWTVDAGAFFAGEHGQWFWKGKFPQGVRDPAYREYYVRMLEWAAYLPMFRSHGTDTPREIWNFGERGAPHFDAIEKTIRGRYELLPYIYSVAAKVTREGYTMARLLAFDFADDLKVRDIKDEYMFGPSLLVAPVTDPGVVSRKVYLPKFKTANGKLGAWYDCRTGVRYAAGETVDAPAPLDSIPVFQKAGSIVVKGPVTMHADAQRGLPLEVVVAPGDNAEFTLYDDDGITYDYERGAFSTTRLVWNDASGKLTSDARDGAASGQLPEQKLSVRVLRP